MSLAAAVSRVAVAAARHAELCDRQATFPSEAMSEMRMSGLLGLMVSEDLGGLGGRLTDMIDATVALGQVDMSTAMIFAMHCQQVVAIDRYAAGPVREKILRSVAKGETYIASVTTEVGTGGHLLTSESGTKLDRNALTIDRMAPVVTGGQHADAFLITVLAPGAESPTQVSLVYAWREQLAIEGKSGWDPLGMRATESVALRLRGQVPTTQVLGEIGRFREIATTVFAPLAHLGWAAAWLGTAAGALERVVKHVRSPEGRKQIDTTSDLVLSRLADVRACLDAVNALLRHAVQTVEGGADVQSTSVQLLLNALKIRAAQECFAAVDALIELTGLRHGYLPSPLALERSFRDLRSASLNYSNDRLRLVNGSLVLMDAGVHLA